MKDRPILFSAPMVRALLSGTKSQTRRAISERLLWHFIDGQGDLELCPYGKPGDQLWVRETWAAHWMYDDVPPSAIPSDGESLIRYPADDYVTEHAMGADHFRKLRPSIHMPRWVSRITLRITDVRVERLHDISEADALAEGARSSTLDARADYRQIWQEINGDESWGTNPWVWVVKFNKVKP